MYYDDVVLSVMKDKAFEFNSIQDLKEKKISLERGSSKGEEFYNLIRRLKGDQTEVFQMIIDKYTKEFQLRVCNNNCIL